MSVGVKDDAKRRHYRFLLRRGVPPEHARRLATGYLFGIGVKTDTQFVAGWGDGIGGTDQYRKQRHQAAQRAGVSTAGATYCPGLCAPGKPQDPAAWVPHENARGYIEKRCEQLGYGCEGAVNVARREPTSDPHEGPYRVAEDIVDREVDRIVDQDHGGVISTKKRTDLTEATQERLAGN